MKNKNEIIITTDQSVDVLCLQTKEIPVWKLLEDC